MWLLFAILSAVFAAATAVLAKIGIEGVGSNLATAIRTIVVLLMAWGMVFVTQLRWRHRLHHPAQLVVPHPLRTRHRSLLALLLLCHQDWRSEQGGAHRQVQPCADYPFCRPVPRRGFYLEIPHRLATAAGRHISDDIMKHS